MNLNNFKKTTLMLTLSIPISQVFAIPSDLGYRFIHNSIGIRDLTVNYGPVYTGAGTDFSNAGNLSFFAGPANLDPPYAGHVAFSEGNYGATPWAAIANAFNQLDQPCTDLINGLCNR